MKLLYPEFSHIDSRRMLQQLITANIKQVNYYKAHPGAVLGDHFHKETVEYFFVASGKVAYNDEQVMGPGDFFAVYPEENHKLECITEVELLTFLTKEFDKEKPDLWKK